MFKDISKLAMNSKTGDVDILDAPNAVIEPKYDGIRLLIHVTEDGVQTFARSGNEKTGKLPAIEAEVFAALPAGAWLDGEAVDFNEDGTQNWGGAQSVLGANTFKAALRSDSIRFVVFDLLSHGGIDARTLRLDQRRELLETIFAQSNFNRVTLSPQKPTSSEAHEENLALGFEGSMVKLVAGTYQSGKRSSFSLKVKATDTIDGVVTGTSPAAAGSWIDQAGLIGTVDFVHYLDGKEIHGRCSGMSTQERKRLTEMGDAIKGQVIEVSYMTRMPSGSLRHPNFKRIRTDKTEGECKS